jgi:hypothetical protein
MDLQTLKKKIISFIADIRIYAVGIVLWGESYYKLKGPEQREILNELEPGDILLRRYDNYLGSVVIPGYWSHVALYVGENLVIHMLGKGIVQEDILTFLRCDNLAVMRCEDENRIYNAIEEAKIQLLKGVDYDFDFNTKCEEKFYCTELVEYVFKGFSYKKHIMKNIIVPDDFTFTDDLKFVWPKEEGILNGGEEEG